MKRTIALLLFTATIMACHSPKTAKPGITGNADPVLPVDRRAVFCLSMLSNLPASTTGGMNVTDTAQAVANIIAYTQPKIDSILAHGIDSSIAGDTVNLSVWTRVWGPAVSVTGGDPLTAATNGTLVSANSMSIFMDRSNNYVVAIQATNPYCPYDWMTLDFSVASTQPWLFSGTKQIPSGNISQGTFTGLQNLFQLTDSSSKLSAYAFLKQMINTGNATNTPNTVTVTGHSLGGALAPVYALYLQETFDTATIKSKPAVYCLSTAGATPGDATFANYYMQKDNGVLGKNTVRLWNNLDIIPHAWVDTLFNRIINGIYDSTGGSVSFDTAYNIPNCKNGTPPVAFKPQPTPAYLVPIIEAQKLRILALNYTHLCGNGISFTGALNNSNTGNRYISVPPDTSLYRNINYYLKMIDAALDKLPFANNKFAGDTLTPKDSTTFFTQLGAQHVSAYTLYFNVKQIHNYTRYIVQQDPNSIVNFCPASATRKESKSKQQPVTFKKPAGIMPYAAMMAAVLRKAWEW